MSKSIKTYEDLLKERQQLEALLQTQKELMQQDIVELKQQIQPAVKAVSFLGKLFTRENDSLLLTGGINFVTDLLFKNLILSRSGWLTRLAVPFFIKNFSSHFVAEHKTGLIKKLFSLFGHKHSSNGQTTADMS